MINHQSMWAANPQRDKTVVISDLHLGVDDRYTETQKNRALLVEFLQRLEKTDDVKELVIAGDFLDAWFLPVYYPSYTDEDQFYRDVAANNQAVMDALNHLIQSDMTVVYVAGNHDLTMKPELLDELLPGIVQIHEKQGLGRYYTGKRKEIVIEHGHRYDAFSAPDTLTNRELCGNDETILPMGYFYARYGATAYLEGYPKVEKDLPVITQVPDPSDVDQYGAYLYYSILKGVSERCTPKVDLQDKIFDMHIGGFDDAYSYLDFYPAQQEDGTISAPVLFKNIQRTWDERQKLNDVKRPNSFIEAASGTLDSSYYTQKAVEEYLENPDEQVEVVVFGHTHIPGYCKTDMGKTYINSGTWIDHNLDDPDATCIFAVITSEDTDIVALYSYQADGSLQIITKQL
ncbi:Calcineurin-like phosphoesterase [Eubacterium aggregans]|uniref:Calcineurin-like phosphoesterase n=1 Tax=Eubacterium aggregans TaxID=81409 RepID=A0A1H4BCK9_9FIRM|nr:metallophosphoesterase [Eubacterium aggregans]MDD4509274.1 metallophosphoesterase [Eubacteriaceae bacterium]SEA45847.1 Calcineurin-like phosphoesterase [Eubacterium aggregans]